MPSITCPRCGFVVPFLGEFVATPRCPGCGGELTLPADEPAAPPTAEENVPTVPIPAARPRRIPEAEPLPLRRPDPPAGVARAGLVWVVCGWVGIGLNLVLASVYGAVARERQERLQTGDDPLAFTRICGMVLAALALYALLIYVGRRARRGRLRGLAGPGWWFLFVALGLAFLNLFFAAYALVVSNQRVPNMPLPDDRAAAALVLATYWLFAWVFVALDLVIYLAAVALLWHAGWYRQWALTGRTRPDDGRPPLDLPARIRFAGWAWIWVGVLGCALAGLASSRYFAVAPPADHERAAVFLLFSALCLMPLLAIVPLGVLILNGRLAGTRRISYLALFFALVALAIALATLASPVGPTPMRVGQEAALLELRYPAVLRALIVIGLALAAAVAGIVGDKGYRQALREAYGWRA